MSNVRWGARYDPGQRTWILARADKQGGVICVSQIRMTCEAVMEQDGHLEFYGEVLVNGSTVDIVRKPTMVADSVWIRHLVKVDQVVNVKPVAMGAKAKSLIKAKIIGG